VRLSGRFETGGSPDGVIELLVEDATERRTLEAQLAHTTKMESIGRLAGGIAHDFNNLLTAILGYVDLMQGSLSEQDPIARHALQIRRSAERASLLTRQLLAFSRKQFLQPRVIDLNAVVEESNQMLRRLISEHIELSASLDPRLLRIKVDPAQLQQVLLNLAVNARDAMPKGGTLGIVTANVDLPARALGGAPDFEAGPYVMLAVSDTGVGMDTNTRPGSSSRSSPPSGSAKAPASACRPSTASSARAAATSRSTASAAAARASRSTSPPSATPPRRRARKRC
jgi:signal transduction histidine kinase